MSGWLINRFLLTNCHVYFEILYIRYPPDPQVVPAGGQQVRVNPLGVGDPHDLGGGVGMVESVPAHELGALLLQTHQLDLHTTPSLLCVA